MRCHRVLVVGALISVASCADDPVAPPAPATSVRLCWAGDWLAIRNEGRAWTRVARQPDGSATFLATDRLAIARAGLASPSPWLRVEYVTAAQLVARQRDCGVGRMPPTGRVAGVVTGLPDQAHVEVMYGGRSHATASSYAPTFTLYALDGANDLLALRWPDMSASADRAILRRAQSYADGASVTLDFGSAEAFPLATHTVRWTGPSAHVQVNFLTGQDVLYGRGAGNRNFLHSEVVGTGEASIAREMIVRSLPADRLAPGDMHQLMLSSGSRSLLLFYHVPAERALVLGPPAAAPTFTTLATSPRLRFRADVPAQPEYGGSVHLHYAPTIQPGMTVRPSLSLLMTREYLGATPATWRLEVPDLSGVDGLPSSVDIPPGDHEWWLYLSSAEYAWDAEDATDGQQVRHASREGTRRP